MATAFSFCRNITKERFLGDPKRVNGVTMRLPKCQNFDAISVQGPSKRNNDEEGSGIHLEETWTTEEDCGLQSYSPLSTHFGSLFKFFRFLGISPSSYEYDPISESFILHKGSWLRKVIGLLLHLTTSMQSMSLAKLHEIQVKNNTVLVMSKLHSHAYIVLGFILFGILMRKGEEIRGILDSVQQAYINNLKAGAKPVSRARILFDMFHHHGPDNFLLLYTIGRIVERPWNFLEQGLGNYVDEVANTQAKAFYMLFSPHTNHSHLETFHLGEHVSHGTVKAVGIISFLLDWWAGLSCIGAYVLCVKWAAVFWVLLSQFFQVFGHGNSTRSILSDLRTFNAITNIIDRFNKVLGLIVLATIFTGMMHFSLNLVGIFFPSGCWFQKFTEFLMFIGFGVQLVTCAHVHAMAGNIFQKMKLQFQETSFWSKPDCSCVETTQGMLLILHDVQSNNVGLQGLGFFTCSYSFIGTVLSVISTYAIVVIQFQSY